MTQETALDLLKNGNDNIFLTGAPGTGKSYLIDRYVDWLLENGTDPVITASTGIAALNVKGRTLHSWSGLRNDDELEEADVEAIENGYARDNYIGTSTLIIDEISMVSARMLDNVNRLAKRIRNDSRPFGGIRVIAVGDFFQLPPVKGRYAFLSESWEDMDFTVAYLLEEKRQTEPEFTGILRNLRSGFLTADQKTLLRERVIKDATEIPDPKIRLDTHNAKVDSYNQRRLERLSGAPHTYVMQSSGYENSVEKLKKSCLSPERLTLKVGTPVLFTRNDTDLRWVNGTQGVVSALQDHSISVELLDGTVVDVDPVSWEDARGYGGNKKIYAEISQIPVKLAWSITIHKSQGMTLDRAVIDVNHAFADGQSYVALSRVRTLDGLYLQGEFHPGWLRVSKTVIAFDKEIRPV